MLVTFPLESYPVDCKSPEGYIVFKAVQEGMCPEGSEEVKNEESMKTENIQAVDCKSPEGYIVKNIRKGMCPEGYEEVKHEEPTRYEYRESIEESNPKSSGETPLVEQKGPKKEPKEVVEEIKGGEEGTSKVEEIEKEKGSEDERKKGIWNEIVAFIVIIVLILLALGGLGGYLELKQEKEKERRLRALKLSDIDNMNGTEFERYVGRLLEHQGFKIKLMGGSGDLGVDIIAQKNNLKYSVQVKRHTNPVSRHAVSDAVAGKDHYGCNKAMVVTNNHFTEGAKELARSTGCELISRDILAEWILGFQNRRSNIG